MENKELVFTGENGQILTNSLLAAEKFGKEHQHILRDIRNLMEGVSKIGDTPLFEESSYVHPQNGQGYPMYVMNRDGFTLLVMGFTGDKALQFKLDYIQAFNEMERKIKYNTLGVPTSFREALLLAAKQQEEIEEQQKQIVDMSHTICDMKKKTDYLDIILQSKGTVTISQIGNDYGMSVKKLNKLLFDFGIQRKVNGQWILYAKYLPFGYVHSKYVSFTHSDGRPDVSMNTEWTQKGRLFLYEELKKRDILPLIEQ